MSEFGRCPECDCVVRGVCLVVSEHVRYFFDGPGVPPFRTHGDSYSYLQGVRPVRCGNCDGVRPDLICRNGRIVPKGEE